jgi:hypothetical protein
MLPTVRIRFYTMHSKIRCGCCRLMVSAGKTLYDTELEEFVCLACWPDLTWAQRELLALRLAPSQGVKMERRYRLPEDAS